MAIRGGCAAAFIVGLSASAARAEPAPPHVELRWSAPRECPDDLALLREVEGFLGESLDRAAEQPLGVDARVQGDSSHGYAAKLSFASARGSTERALEHPECAKLTEAVALLIALAIDPERVRAHQEAGAVESSSLEAEPTPPEKSPPPRQEPAQPPVTTLDQGPSPPAYRPAVDASVRASVAILGLVGGGMLPSAAPGIGPELALRFGHFEAAAVGRFWATRSAAVPGTPDASLELSLFTGGLRLCGVPTHGPWSLPACARADVGRMTGDGQHVDNQRTGRDWFAGVGGSLAVAYTLGRFSPIAGADLLATTARPRFGVLRVGQEVQAFRPQPWQLSGFIGLAYSL